MHEGGHWGREPGSGSGDCHDGRNVSLPPLSVGEVHEKSAGAAAAVRLSPAVPG